jgi:hypothetical protein
MLRGQEDAPEVNVASIAPARRRPKALVIETNLARMPLVGFVTAKWLHSQDLKVEFLKGDLTGNDVKLIVLLQSAFDRWGTSNKIRFTLAQAESQWGVNHELVKSSLRRLKGVSIETQAIRNDPRSEVGISLTAGFGLIDSWKVVSRGRVGGVEVEINGVIAALLRRGSLTLLDKTIFFALAGEDQIAARLWIFLETQSSHSWKYGLFAASPFEAREVAPLADLLGLKNARRGRVVKRIREAAEVVARNDPGYALEVVPSPERGMFTLHVRRLKQSRHAAATNQRVGIHKSADRHPAISGAGSANQRIRVQPRVQNRRVTSSRTSIQTSVVTVDGPQTPEPRQTTNDGATRHLTAIEGVSDSVSRAWSYLPRSRLPSEKQRQVLIEKEAQWGTEQLADFLDARGAEGKDTYHALAAIFEFVRAEAGASKVRDRDLAAEGRPQRASQKPEGSGEGGSLAPWHVLEETMLAHLEAVSLAIPLARLETLRQRIIRMDWEPSKLCVLVSSSSSGDRAWEAELAGGMADILGHPFTVEIREKAKPMTTVLAERSSAPPGRRSQRPHPARPELDPNVLAAFVAATGAQSCPPTTADGLDIATRAMGVTRVVAWLNQHAGIDISEVGPQIVLDLADGAEETGAVDSVLAIPTKSVA